MTPTDGIKSNKVTTPPISFGFSTINPAASDSTKASKELGTHFSKLGGGTNIDDMGLTITKTNQTKDVASTNTNKSADGLPPYFSKYDTPQLRSNVEGYMQNYDQTLAQHQDKGRKAMNAAFSTP